MRILVIAAHPDDEILGCGATTASHVAAGHEVAHCILGEGVTSRYARREDAPPGDIERLRLEAREAARRVGVSRVIHHALPDNRLDAVPMLDVVRVVEQALEDVRPEVVYTHHVGDLNVDHGVVARAVLTATRTVSSQCVREIYAFEVPSSTEWAFNQIEPRFRPNTFQEVSEAALEKKVHALLAYDGEARPFPHPRSPDALRAYGRRWGSVCGGKAAEAFELVRAVRRTGG